MGDKASVMPEMEDFVGWSTQVLDDKDSVSSSKIKDDKYYEDKKRRIQNGIKKSKTC